MMQTLWSSPVQTEPNVNLNPPVTEGAGLGTGRGGPGRSRGASGAADAASGNEALNGVRLAAPGRDPMARLLWRVPSPP